MKNKRINNIPGLLLVVAVVIAGGCTTEGKPVNEEKEKVLTVVETAEVKKEITEYTLNLSGELQPFERVKLFPKVKGFVQNIYVDRGSEVKKGQLLATLEAPEITQQYKVAQARLIEVREHLKYSRQKYNRLKEAAKETGAVADNELEKAHATVMSDSAAYNALQAEMAAVAEMSEYLEIRAPFDGVVVSRGVSKGALVGGNGEPLFTLAHNDRLRLTIAIPEKHARALSDSTIIYFRTSSYPDEKFKAHLARSSKVLDQELRSLMVEFDVLNEERKFNGGEYVMAEVSFQRKEASLWVPATSIVKATSGVFVVKVENNSIQRVPVKEGISKNSWTEVYGDLSQNDRVVLKGSEELKEGTEVQVK